MNAPRKAEPSESLRRLAVELAEQGDAAGDVAQLLGVGERSVWRWLAAWRARGEGSLATGRRTGRPPKLTPRRAGALLSWVDRSPCDFGFATERWTAPRLAWVLERELGVTVNHRYLSDWLGRHGVTPQVPQRVPKERDEAKVAAWAREQWPAIKKKWPSGPRPLVSRTRAGSS
jgi:transposase